MARPGPRPDWPQPLKTGLRAAALAAAGSAMIFPFFDLRTLGRPTGLDMGWTLWVYGILPGLLLGALAAPFVKPLQRFEEVFDAVAACCAFVYCVLLFAAWLFFAVAGFVMTLILFPFILPMLAGEGEEGPRFFMEASMGPGGWLLLLATALAILLLLRGTGAGWKSRAFPVSTKSKREL